LVGLDELEGLLTEEELLEYSGLSEVDKANYKLWRVVDRVVFTAKVQFGDTVEFLASAIFRGPVTFNADTVGSLTIPAGATKIKVTFSQPFESVPIVNLTPTSMTYDAYSLENVTEEGFEVSIVLDLTFNWTAFLTEGEGAKVEVVDPLAGLGQGDFGVLMAEYNQLAEESLETPQSPSSLITILDSELGYVRVREEPTTDSSQVGQVLPGEVYTYDEVSEGDWYRIEYLPAQAGEEGLYGWVSGTYVEVVE